MGNQEKILNGTQIWWTKLKRSHCLRNDFTPKFWAGYMKIKAKWRILNLLFEKWSDLELHIFDNL